MKFEVGNFTFDSTFDSGNLARVDLVKSSIDREYHSVVPRGLVPWVFIKSATFDDAIWKLSSELSIFQFILSLSQLEERQFREAILLRKHSENRLILIDSLFREK